MVKNPLANAGDTGVMGLIPGSLAPHERLPELPDVPRVKPHTGAADRENPRDAPVFAT